jgi:hypothetical protein
MQPRRVGALALGFSLVGVVLVVLLIGIAAGVGPSGLTHGQSRDTVFHRAGPAPATSTSPGLIGTAPPVELPQGQSDIPFAGLIGLVLRLCLAAWLVWMLMKGLLWLKEELEDRKTRHRDRPPLAVDFDVLEDPEPLADELRRDADDQLALLLGGEPRNAIVACWERFEEQAERVGLARKLWETSSEFTIRVLEALAADPEAISTLAALYREARFSEHVISEPMRQQAVDALRRIQATAGGRAVRP